MGKKPAIFRNSFFMARFQGFLVAIVLMLSAAASHAADISITYKEGRLSALVSGAQLIDVLKALSDQYDTAVFVDDSIQSKKISVTFNNLELEDGVKRLVNPYNSAMIFTKKTDSYGREYFHLSQIKVFNKDSAAATFVTVNGEDKEQDHSVRHAAISGETYRVKEMADRIRSTPSDRKDAARSAEMNKKISASVRRSQVTQTLARLQQAKNKKLAEEAKTYRLLEEAKSRLDNASEQDLQRIQAQISMYNAELRTTRARNSNEIKRLERELARLQKGTI